MRRHGCLGFLPKKKSSGQISLLIIFSLVPIFALFAFVVNVGMLVNAKISLQNAADLAAYAGAATQARQLTQISHINYRMRQTYKKFLFRYYVVGNLAMKCFPRGAGYPSECNPVPVTTAGFDFSNPPQRKFPKVPAICLSLSKDSNPCQLGSPVPLVTPPSCIPLDPTCGILQNAAKAIQDIQKKSCTANSEVNREVVTHWLYNTDTDPQLFQQKPELAGLVNDLGLVVEETLLRQRIETLRGYINENARTNVTLQTAENPADQAKTERTVMSFKTVLGNLNEKVFDHNEIALTELMPQNQPMLNLKDVEAEIKLPYVVMGDSANGGGNDTTCSQYLDAVSAKPVLGVYKMPNSVVYYAVRVKARAKILYNPFPFKNPDDGIELTAFAAAKPFGSRIGPEIEGNEEFTKVYPGPFQGLGGQAIPELRVPYIKFSKGNSTDIGIDQVGVLEEFYKTIAPQSAGTAGTITKNQLEAGEMAAQLPDENELGRYNIPTDVEYAPAPTNKGMVRYFGGGNDKYSFWAPVAGGDGIGKLADMIKDAIRNQMMDGSLYCIDGTLACKSKEVMAGFFTERVNGYISSTLVKEEGFNVARIHDPLSKAFFTGSGAQYPALGDKGKVLDSFRLATSFTTDRDPFYYNAGRDGYSVKFVPFKLLLATPGRISNMKSSGPWPVINDSFQGLRQDLLNATH